MPIALTPKPNLASDRATVAALQAAWVWTPTWLDAPEPTCKPDPNPTAGRLVHFKRTFTLPSTVTPGQHFVLHMTADTRYKLVVNGGRAAVGPSRGSEAVWYYDTVDIGHLLQPGENVVDVFVMRYFYTSRSGFPFGRTAWPGLTIVGGAHGIDLGTAPGSHEDWRVRVLDHIKYPTNLVDDVFMHINEWITPAPETEWVVPKPYALKTLNGDQAPWRLTRRVIPMPEETPLRVDTIRALSSPATNDSWQGLFSSNACLPVNGTHTVDLQAESHSTAFLSFSFTNPTASPATLDLKLTYSEGYELEPRLYPWLRTKGDRLDSSGRLVGPSDVVTLVIPPNSTTTYEPFWFRTFRLLRLELSTLSQVEFSAFNATQTNYPMNTKASWNEPADPATAGIWEICHRTLRNCMFDGYADCPFYEQLQYAGDTRTVALFHYYLSGDDALMRQAISLFAASTTPSGLTQSRYPSHVPQVIAGFGLYWILSVCDHYTHFGDTAFTKQYLHIIDGILAFFDRHVDALGLVSGLPDEVWQYVDWVHGWEATPGHPDKGVPVAGRKSNRHTFFSMLYAYTLREAARIIKNVSRPALASEYASRADTLVEAINGNCFDATTGFYTDTTLADSPPLHPYFPTTSAYSQHCQVLAVLSGCAASPASLLTAAFAASSPLGKVSYAVAFYAFRAFAAAGIYEEQYTRLLQPWRAMLDKNLSTLEEDDVRQRSDCHAWGAVPVYEFCAEVAGLTPASPGWGVVRFAPRLRLSQEVAATVALGAGNVGAVKWKTEGGVCTGSLKLEHPAEVVLCLPGHKEGSLGVVSEYKFSVTL